MQLRRLTLTDAFSVPLRSREWPKGVALAAFEDGEAAAGSPVQRHVLRGEDLLQVGSIGSPMGWIGKNPSIVAQPFAIRFVSIALHLRAVYFCIR